MRINCWSSWILILIKPLLETSSVTLKGKKGTPKPFKVTKSFFTAVSLEKGGGASQSLLCMLLLPYQSHSLANSCLFSFSLSLPFFPHFADSQKGPRYSRCCCFLPFDLHGFLSLTILSFSVSIYNPSVLTISTPAEPILLRLSQQQKCSST